MPLDDSGGFEAVPGARHAPVDPLYAHEHLGAALKAVRRDKGLALDDLAETTRVRRPYLEAIEEMRLDVLPSRPFTIGYIRAYATALGLDPELAVDRFKAEEPVLDEPLRAPVGVVDEKDPRIGAFVAGALVIIAAIVLWNVAQRSMTANAPPPAIAPEAAVAKALAQVKSGPVTLGPPLPAPVESTIPPAYETPGLAAAGEDGKQNLAPPGAVTDLPPDPLLELAPLPPTFVPGGKIYDSGNPRLTSSVTLQARKNAALIVRGADGSVFFARQLAKGEAYRVPDLAGLTIDVSSPRDFQVFVANQSRGVLPAQQVLASKLITAPPTTAAPAATAPQAAPPAAAPAPATAAAPRPAAPAPAKKISPSP